LIGQTPALVFCIYRGSQQCRVQELLRKTVDYCGSPGVTACRVGEGQELLRPSIAARLLYVNRDRPDLVEVWLRVSGDYGVLEAFTTVLKRESGVSFQIVQSSRYSMIVRVLFPREPRCLSCKWCPLVSSPLGSMVRSIVFTPEFMLLELLVAKPQALRELEHRGCLVVSSVPVDGVDYSLTEKQEYALVQAFMEGYYSYPRRVSVKELAAKLRVSSSALAELLRKAEQKIVEKYIIEELPHYLVQHVLRRPRLREPRRRVTGTD